MKRLFVYGSLMVRAELERVLGRPYDGTFEPYVLRGYVRDWSASEGGYAYLNLRPDADGFTAGFVISVDDFVPLDAWESTYSRVPVGDVEIYICRPEFCGKASVVSRRYRTLVQSAIEQALPELPGHLSVADEAEGSDV